MKKRQLSIFAVIFMLLMSLIGCSTDKAGSSESKGKSSDQKQDSVTFKYEETIPWDAEYDVVVAGFGGAGAVTAITAADEGAKVLLLEKAPKGHEGGNTRYSSQHVVGFSDYDQGVEYLKAVRGLYTNWSDEAIEQFVEKVNEFPEWWNSFGYTEYKILPRKDYELPGGDSVIMYYTEEPGNPRFWEGLREQVIKRSDKIEVWYDSPGKELIQDPYTKTILGIKVETEGKTVNIRAKNGVVLSTGGFENNPEMIQDYLQRPYNGHFGTPYNTGDGIKMTQAVGADLWHMNATSGPYPGFVNPETGDSVHASTSDLINYASSHGAIYVGPDGTRFLQEDTKPKHGYDLYHGAYMTIQFPQKSYMIFDAASMKDKIFKSWSEGNKEELAKNWIVQAGTLDELAKSIGVNGENLVKEVEKYNGYVAKGEDEDLGRAPETLIALGEGPYYALEVTPMNLNTQGGPKRNLDCEVLDTQGNPIPHLYTAGELGSMHPGLYQGGSNLGEDFVTGRIAGVNASAAKKEIQATSLEVVKQPEPFVKKSQEKEYTVGENEYLGESAGMGGRLVLKVKMDGDKIVNVEVLEHSETKGIGDKAIEKLIPEIIEANSAEVDAATGASMTSAAIKEAVADALSKVK